MIEITEIRTNVEYSDSVEIKKIKGLRAVVKILKIIDEMYVDHKVREMLQILLNTKCNRVEIEYPYLDKDYLSTYYSFYSKNIEIFQKKTIEYMYIMSISIMDILLYDQLFQDKKLVELTLILLYLLMNQQE